MYYGESIKKRECFVQSVNWSNFEVSRKEVNFFSCPPSEEKWLVNIALFLRIALITSIEKQKGVCFVLLSHSPQCNYMNTRRRIICVRFRTGMFHEWMLEWASLKSTIRQGRPGWTWYATCYPVRGLAPILTHALIRVIVVPQDSRPANVENRSIRVPVFIERNIISSYALHKILENIVVKIIVYYTPPVWCMFVCGKGKDQPAHLYLLWHGSLPLDLMSESHTCIS